MMIQNIISNIRHMYLLDHAHVGTLFRLSRISLIGYIILSIAIYLIYDYFENENIFYWTLLAVGMGLGRIALSFLYSNYTKHLSPTLWYKFFLVSNVISAFLYAWLSVYHLPSIENDALQYLTAIALIGLSGGSISPLSPDIRIAIGYSGIVLLPAIITLWSMDFSERTITGVFLLFYYISFVIFMVQVYKQNRELSLLKESTRVLENVFREAPIGIFSYDEKLTLTAQNKILHKLLPKTYRTNPLETPMQEVMENALKQKSATYFGDFEYEEKKHYIDIKCFALQSTYKNSLETTETTGGRGIGIVEDKTREYNALQKLTFFANHDPLTNLFNRRSLQEQMRKLLQTPLRKEYAVLYYIDLDQFKEINDSLGHKSGDTILKRIAKKLEDAFPTAILSRLGGDEFIVLINHITPNKHELSTFTSHYEQKLIDIFKEPITLNGIPLYIYFSAGAVIIEPHEKNSGSILHHADITMYHAKKSLNNIVYYTPSLTKGKKEAFFLQNHFKNALHQNELELYYQPIAKIKNNKIVAAEGLLRWHHPQKGLLYPKSFLHANMKPELLSKITWWTLEQACKQISTWKQKGVWKLRYISINIHTMQLSEQMFVEQLLALLQKYHVSPSEILLEITEHSLIHKFEEIQAILNQLQTNGIHCAIDDFGIGYSSLSYLKQLSFHTLKIDKAFVQNIETNEHALNLISIMFDMAHQCNYHIVVEGIEKEEQQKLLCKLDSHVTYQGFLLSRAIGASQFKTTYLSKETS
jgi:diguanylate cyclase (GGDEF)-like protein